MASDIPALELTACPEHGRPAEILSRVQHPSTRGPIEHIKVRCSTGQWSTVVPELR